MNMSIVQSRSWSGVTNTSSRVLRMFRDFGCVRCRAVLAEAIMQALLEAQEEPLDVCVASASVGPAPAGETKLHWPQPFVEASPAMLCEQHLTGVMAAQCCKCPLLQFT